MIKTFGTRQERDLLREDLRRQHEALSDANEDAPADKDVPADVREESDLPKGLEPEKVPVEKTLTVDEKLAKMEADLAEYKANLAKSQSEKKAEPKKAETAKPAEKPKEEPKKPTPTKGTSAPGPTPEQVEAIRKRIDQVKSKFGQKK